MLARDLGDGHEQLYAGPARSTATWYGGERLPWHRPHAAEPASPISQSTGGAREGLAGSSGRRVRGEGADLFGGQCRHIVAIHCTVASKGKALACWVPARAHLQKDGTLPRFAGAVGYRMRSPGRVES